MKLNIIIKLCFFSLYFYVINAYEVELVFSNYQMDGEVAFQDYDHLFWREYSDTLIVGDDTTVEYFPAGNWNFRSYISFDLPTIPIGYSIDTVCVRLYQINCYGNGEQNTFPIWNVAGGDTLFCIIDHIDYGDYLFLEDWTAGDPGDPQTLHTNIGLISDSAVNGFRYFDMTDYVLDDYDNSRSRSQYRIRFQIITDEDGLEDFLVFGAGDYNDFRSPIMFVFYSQETDISNENQIPHAYKIQNYPNPFNPETIINYQISQHSKVLLQVYNTKGQLIETLVNECQSAGKHSVIWNAENQSSGIYLYRITTGTHNQTGKCLLLK